MNPRDFDGHIPAPTSDSTITHKKPAKQPHFSPFPLVHTNPKRYNFRYRKTSQQMQMAKEFTPAAMATPELPGLSRRGRPRALHPLSPAERAKRFRARRAFMSAVQRLKDSGLDPLTLLQSLDTQDA